VRGRRERAVSLCAGILVSCLLATGCDSADDLGEALAAEPTVESGAEVARSEADGEPAIRAPLTGLPLDDEAVLGRPAVAVKVDNAAAAWPQAGLADADVVFSEPVEGGLTRFVAFYHAVLPERVGPVRSGREVDADLLPPFEPIYAYSGAATPVLGLLRDTGMVLREEGLPIGGWNRDPSRRAPHNLFVSPAMLLDGAGPGEVSSPWTIGREGTAAPRGAGTAEVEEVTIRYSSATQVGWAWDDAAAGWVRTQGDATHFDDQDTAVTATNVVVARVAVRDGDRTDGAGNPVVDMTVLGEGDALVLMDGVAVTARWARQPGGHFSWTTADGEALELLPGNTWVEFVPTSGAVEPTPAAVG
jgi:hypothetical protein